MLIIPDEIPDRPEYGGTTDASPVRQPSSFVEDNSVKPTKR